MAVLIVGSGGFATIAAAIAAANPGDTLSLQAGYANDSAMDTVQNLSLTGGGTSTGIAMTMGAGVADFTLLGSAPINVTDNADNNVITGNTGDNVISVSGGTDTVHGGTGTDLLMVDYSNAPTGAITANISGAAGTIADGGPHSVTFDGMENVDLTTGAGNDVITSVGGSNVFFTGDGDDTVTTSGLGNDEVHGGAGNDTITTGAGNDLVDGGAGDDTLTGGLGVDAASYIDAASGVHVSLLVVGAQNTFGAGTDTLVGFEKLIGSQFADTLIANTTGSTLNGLNGGDDLVGGAGNDILNGGGASDFADYSLATAGVTVNLTTSGFQNTGGAGSDELISIEKLSGSNFADTLTGDSGGNALYGAGGNDVLVGGAGQDNLAGGGGADSFVFTATSDSTVAAPDTILDFQAGDHIDLSAIDADTTTGGDQAFHLGATVGHTGDIVVGAFANGHTEVDLYVNGDATPDAAIWLNGNHTGLTAGDFVL